MTLSFNLRVIQGYFEPTLWRTIRIFVMGQKNNFLRKKEKSALRQEDDKTQYERLFR